MKKYYLLTSAISIFLSLSVKYSQSQQNKSNLSIDKIMQGKDFIGYWPHDVFWSPDNQNVFFYWNPEKKSSDSVYKITPGNKPPVKVSIKESNNFFLNYEIDKTKTTAVCSLNGDLYIQNLKNGITKRITETIETEEEPTFSFDNHKIIYVKNSNLYAWNRTTGTTKQITNFVNGLKKLPSSKVNDRAKWLRNDQLQNSKILTNRVNIKNSNIKTSEKQKMPLPKPIYIGTGEINESCLSPNEQFVYYQLYLSAENTEYTKVPNYITESGYTETKTARQKVGSPLPKFISFIYDINNDTSYAIKIEDLNGIFVKPEYLNDTSKNKIAKSTIIFAPVWNKSGDMAFSEIRSLDNKDRY